jgi:hypothetical protein
MHKAELLAPIDEEYVPEGQLLQKSELFAASVSENVPTGQGAATEMLVAATTYEKYPAGIARHAMDSAAPPVEDQ